MTISFYPRVNPMISILKWEWSKSKGLIAKTKTGHEFKSYMSRKELVTYICQCQTKWR